MTTINDNLKAIQSEKQALKNALIEKGVDMTKVPFTDYHLKVAEISSSSTIVEREIASSDITFFVYSAGGGGGGSQQVRMTVTVPELIDETKNVIAVVVQFSLLAGEFQHCSFIYTKKTKTLQANTLTPSTYYLETSSDNITVAVALGKSSYSNLIIYKAIVIYEE